MKRRKLLAVITGVLLLGLVPTGESATRFSSSMLRFQAMRSTMAVNFGIQ
jgi:hypothetical protein